MEIANLKVCKDCPLYTARHLFNSSRTVELHHGSELAARQESFPTPLAQFMTFPKVEVTLSPDISEDAAAEAFANCNEATTSLYGLAKAGRIARNVINASRHTECPAFEQLQQLHTQVLNPVE